MKNILITGASGGLGLELSKKLLKEGYFVYMHYHQHHQDLELLHQQYPNQCTLLQADFSNENDLLKMVTQITRPLDALINNAAVEHLSSLAEKSIKTMDRILKINTIAPFFLMQKFAPQINSLQGAIINISSDNTIDQYDEVTLEYDVSKSGLNQLSRSFARMYEQAKINTICFGWLDTPMNNIPENIKKEMPFIPLTKAVDIVLSYLQTQETGKVDVYDERMVKIKSENLGTL